MRSVCPRSSIKDSFSIIIIIIIIIIIYLLKSTEQEDAHTINTRTRAGQERRLHFALKKKTKINYHACESSFCRTALFCVIV